MNYQSNSQKINEETNGTMDNPTIGEFISNINLKGNYPNSTITQIGVQNMLNVNKPDKIFNRPPKLEIFVGIPCTFTIISDKIHKGKNNSFYKYIRVISEGIEHTLFLDDGLDEAIKDYVKPFNTLTVIKSINDNKICWDIQLHTSDEHKVEEISYPKKYPPKLKIKDNEEVIVQVLSKTPRTGSNNYGPYIYFRLLHEGVEKSHFVNNDFVEKYNNLGRPDWISIKKVVNDDGKYYEINALSKDQIEEYLSRLAIKTKDNNNNSEEDTQ
ncbi:MAG: hypothetical protein HPY57_02240 [Ignavibacteria bacterium]|nr:hypothetical protein [Ignavibacteria bacterium]